MPDPKPLLVTIAILGGHFGFWLLLFNRINATGLDRYVIKRIEKVFMLAALMIPIVVYAIAYREVIQWFSVGSWWPSGSAIFNAWGWLMLGSAAIAGPLWLFSRRHLIPPNHLLKQEVEHFDVASVYKDTLIVDDKFRRCAKLPFNQITQLEVTHKELELPRAIDGIAGLKIGHISDIHLTGKMSQDYYHFAIDRLLEGKPDLVVIAGDIIDYARCLPWLEPVFKRLEAPLGCSYVLGNHDRRLGDVTPVVTQLQQLGLHDLGEQDWRVELPSGAKLWLTGNERPWFKRQKHESLETPPVVEPNELRIGVSHSPDQIGWARRQRLDLMLAGHTHGGQIRIPLVGPLVAPSHYGSQFASGVFYLKPTLMHVSRGLSGVHPFRWFCPPEISILTLRNPAS
ncbi:MAG: metallophosphoesterase [Pirellulaceae bacterium]|nr:metallophosphoesterase [Pirellulaceae bacterium]